ncbi:MAG: Lcl domain-containing protein [Smithellaceae bacterium]
MKMDQRQIGIVIGVAILLTWVSVTLAGSVSEEAQRYMARGMVAVEMANTPKDYERAVREFEQAAKLAPNWPDVYFNLGSVQAKAGNYGEAMRHYKRYLELAPRAPDAAKVREEIYKLEYRAEAQMVKEIKRDGRFIAYDNDTVLDTRTNLMWAAKDNGEAVDWQGAKSYCEKYRGGGYGDWRMPTLNELAGLYDAAKTYSSECPDSKVSGADVHLTELIRLTCVAPWASETRGSVASLFDFNGGGRYWFPPTTGPIYRALPVRPGQSIVDSEKASAASRIAAAYKTGYKGVRNYENGDKYEGEFVNGKLNGKGTFTCNNGKQYTGKFENNNPVGFTINCN